MNQMPISECYLSKFNIQPHYHRLIVYIHKVRWVFQLRRVFQTQVPISLVILVIGIQDLYTSKYKYTIIMKVVFWIAFDVSVYPPYYTTRFSHHDEFHLKVEKTSRIMMDSTLIL